MRGIQGRRPTDDTGLTILFNTNTGDWSGHALQYVAGLQYDSGDYPYDTFDVDWLSAT